MTIGEKIKKIRQEKGLSQKELGKKLGVSQQMIGQWEADRTNPKTQTLDKIANALEVSVVEIMDRFTIEEYKKTKEYKRIQVHVEATYGIIAILKEIYGDVIEKTVEEEYGESFYYLVGKDENKFILYEQNIDKLIEYFKSSVPFIVDEMKDTRSEQEVIEETKKELNDPAYIEYIKKRIEQMENNID